MPADEAVKGQLDRFELVEWLYDGIGGKVIPWTKEHGGTSDDPSAQTFVLTADGEFIARAPDAVQYAPSQFAEWLKEQADTYEREHSKMALPFARGVVAAAGEGVERKVSLPALDEAREAGRPVLVYVGRDPHHGDDKKAETVLKVCRKFEKSVLEAPSLKEAAEEVKGWTYLRLDVANADHAALAETWKASKAPTLLLFLPGEAVPQILAPTVTAKQVAYLLRKHAK